MSIEKMIMLNMIGSIDVLDRVCKSIVLMGCLHSVSALQEINSTDFTLSTTEDNAEALIDVCYIRPYVNEKDYSDNIKKLARLKEICPIPKGSKTVKTEDIIFDFDKLEADIDTLASIFDSVYVPLSAMRNEKEDIENAVEHLRYIKELDVELKDIESLRNFRFSLLKVSKENAAKLKSNYENIPSIIINVYKHSEYEILMSFTPEVLETEAARIFKSLNCETVFLPGKYDGTPQKIINALSFRLKELEKEIGTLEEKLEELIHENSVRLLMADRSLELELLSAELKNNIACTSEFFYLCGWIPAGRLTAFKKDMSLFDNRLMYIEKKPEEIASGITPPTKLSNNLVVKPFETMVKMYGMPSYGEIDPTTFLGISYMIMFGAMFGDVGQGIVFFLAGLLLRKKQGLENMGEILSRLGVSSTVFGFLYGSIFGFEHVIEPLFIRPMEDIMHVLVYAVVFGCCLLVTGFIYSLVNSIRRRDLENGLFGKDGAAGLLFYITIIGFALSKYYKSSFLPDPVWGVLMAVLLTLILFKEPLSNLILNKRPLYRESKSDYFVEGGFGIIETILSLFSNTLSFIRVGAFALNHVGLFLAFSALAKMMQNSMESILMYILGNVIIIALEGLIVFIQGLRLEYYELFSKYYEGSGINFDPITMSK